VAQINKAYWLGTIKSLDAQVTTGMAEGFKSKIKTALKGV
jgi:hypothetical protein